jgi:hypothetical protein
LVNTQCEVQAGVSAVDQFKITELKTLLYLVTSIKLVILLSLLTINLCTSVSILRRSSSL